LLDGGSEFTDAVTAPVVVVELHAARRASRLNTPAPTSTERCKKLLRSKEDPKFGFVAVFVPMKDFLPPSSVTKGKRLLWMEVVAQKNTLVKWFMVRFRNSTRLG
jgi:hypothetical protein